MAQLFEQTHEGDVLVVKMSADRLDAAVAEKFKEAMHDEIEEGAKRIVLNMASLKFMDSSGLGAIISVLKKIRPDGEMVLCEIGDMIQKLLELTRMHKVFRVYDTCEEAIRNFSD